MNKLSTKHFMFFILGVSMISLRSYSSIFIKLGGRDTWIAIFASSIVFILFLIYLLKICIKTDTYNLMDVFNGAFPKWLSNIFILIFTLGLVLVAIESSAVEANSIHTNFFLTTPNWYCLLFLIIPASIILCKKLNTILIIVLVIVTLTVIGDLFLIVLISGYLNFTYLLPILSEGITPNLVTCFVLTLGSLSAVTIVLPYLKFLDKKDGLIKNSTIATAIASLLIISSILSAITFFGPERAGNIFYPEYVQSQRIQIANFLEFGELLYIFRSVCMWFIKYIIASYAILLLFDKKIKYKKAFIGIYSTLIFIASWYAVENQYILFNILEDIQYGFLITLGVVPLIAFTIYYLRTYHVEKKVIKEK